MLLISVMKTSDKLPFSFIVFLKYDVQQCIVPLLEIVFIYNTLPLGICQNLSIHQFRCQQKVWINHLLERIFQMEQYAVSIDNWS